MKKPLLLVALALCAALCRPTVWAQELNLGPLIDPSVGAHAAAQQAVIDDINKGRKARPQGGRVRGTRAVKERGSRSVSSGSTRFVVSRTTRKQLLTNWVARARAVDPKGAVKFEQLLAARDPIDALKPIMAQRYGLRPDDVADAMAVYLTSAWYGARGSNQNAPRSLVRATRAQMHRALLSNPKFASASNATKQNLAESLLIQVYEDDAAITRGKKNPAEMARAKSIIRQVALKTFKLDMTKLKLTSQGLRA